MKKVTLAMSVAPAMLACTALGLAEASDAPTSVKDSDEQTQATEGRQRALVHQPVAPMPAMPLLGGDVLWLNNPVNGVNGYSNATAGVFSERRTLLDDFDLTDQSALQNLRWNSIWETPMGGAMGTGAEISFRADAAGTPGAVIATANVTGYSELPTGNILFSREEVSSFALFDTITLPPGRYWLEATVVGPENNFWLTADQQLNECWVNYANGVPPLHTGTDEFGAASDINFSLFGLIQCILGDVNTDTDVNLLDVSPFVGLLVNGEYRCPGDVNQDGVVNLLDVNPMVDLLLFQQ